MRLLKIFLLAIAAVILFSCSSSDEPEDAFAAVRNMGVGWNLGNTLDTWLRYGPDGTDWEAWETGWGQPVTTPELLLMMKAAGFDAVRVPVTWGVHMDPAGKVCDEWMNRVHEVVDYVLDAGMYCIVNVHHDTGERKDAWVVADMDAYNLSKERYEYLWKQVAEEFRDYGYKLLFESYNEILDKGENWCFPADEGSYDAVNAYAKSFVDVVRSTGSNNRYRNLVINTYAAFNGEGSWSPKMKEPLKRLELPEDVESGHLIFQVHTYMDVTDVANAKARVDDMYEGLQEYLVSKGAPVIIGEWGTSNPGNEPDYIHKRDNVLEYAEHFVRKAKEYGMATFYWMGLSNYFCRSIPAFNEPALAETIVKAHHGQEHVGVYPVPEDFDLDYMVVFREQWTELSLVSASVSIDDYAGVKLVLNPDTVGDMSVKMYAQTGDDVYFPVTSAETFYEFDYSRLGPECRKVTLMNMSKGAHSTVIDEVRLVRKDGSEEFVDIRPLWGCLVEIITYN